MVGDIIKKARIKQGYTQKELAKKLGNYTGQYISNIERNRNRTPLNHIKSLSKILKINKRQILIAIEKQFKKRVYKIFSR